MLKFVFFSITVLIVKYIDTKFLITFSSNKTFRVCMCVCVCVWERERKGRVSKIDLSLASPRKIGRWHIIITADIQNNIDAQIYIYTVYK